MTSARSARGERSAAAVLAAAVAFFAAWLVGGPGGGGIRAATAQQVADTSFTPQLDPPAFAPGKGPVVLLDEAHHNFHTLSGRYAPFGKVLSADGFVVRPSAAPFSLPALAGAKVLVVSNALHPSNDTSWVLPTPSAFTAEEITVVRAWIESGGSLFLIADHMPFAGAASDLGRALGVTFDNGFAVLPGPTPGAPAIFRRHSGSGPSLSEGPILRSVFRRDAPPPPPQIDSVATFTGSAFRPPANATSLLTFPDSAYSLAPDTAWIFSDSTRRTPIAGWSQGAVFGLGKGRVAVFGEAAMFSAQIAGNGVHIGMNAPVAAQNARLLVRLVRWLATGSSDAVEAGKRNSRAQSDASK